MPNWLVVDGNTEVYWVIALDGYYLYYLVLIATGNYPTKTIAELARSAPGIESVYVKRITYAECRMRFGFYPVNAITCMITERVAPNRHSDWHPPRVPFTESYLEYVRPIWRKDDPEVAR